MLSGREVRDFPSNYILEEKINSSESVIKHIFLPLNKISKSRPTVKRITLNFELTILEYITNALFGVSQVTLFDGVNFVCHSFQKRPFPHFGTISNLFDFIDK